MGLKMKKIIYAIALFVATIIAINNLPKNELASVEIINNEYVIYFKEKCEYSSMSLADVNGVGIASIVLSETMGEGPVFLENNYLPITKTFKKNLEKNTEYQIGMTTDCLGNNQIPVYRINFKTK